MTTNQTIDGVPLAVIAAFAKVADFYSEAEDDSYEPWQDAMMHAELRLTLGQFRELRALLDADKVNNRQMGLMEFVEAYPIKPAAQPQGEPVAWRFRVSDSSDWFVTTKQDVAELFRKSPDGSSSQPLYAEQPAPVSVVLPERYDESQYRGTSLLAVRRWNACLDEVIRLNDKSR